ncbi:hypothetical protein CVT25_000499 [Psilocybe cyanescens]|uniref:Uncharacterized protein n=1 Tax=Psilocybe cyanescens TaxID=93625 RepID=A0A409XWC0_PSICY|nr:hypothetical protein CVT25_000499 [Psilocybe cyanescens]
MSTVHQEVEVVVDALASREPSGPNGMTVNWASLTFPAVMTRLEDKGSATALTVDVGIGALVSGVRRLEDTVIRGHLLEFAGREGSRACMLVVGKMRILNFPTVEYPSSECESLKLPQWKLFPSPL